MNWRKALQKYRNSYNFSNTKMVGRRQRISRNDLNMWVWFFASHQIYTSITWHIKVAGGVQNSKENEGKKIEYNMLIELRKTRLRSSRRHKTFNPSLASYFKASTNLFIWCVTWLLVNGCTFYIQTHLHEINTYMH